MSFEAEIANYKKVDLGHIQKSERPHIHGATVEVLSEADGISRCLVVENPATRTKAGQRWDKKDRLHYNIPNSTTGKNALVGMEFEIRSEFVTYLEHK